MVNSASSIKFLAFSLLLTISTTAYSFSTFDTAWDPDANTARNITTISLDDPFSSDPLDRIFNPVTAPRAGSATWSIIGSGISDASGRDTHPGSTTSLDALNPSLTISSLINDAFNTWASVSNFTNGGQIFEPVVTVENAASLGFGAPTNTSLFGDIRIGAIAFDGPGNVLAHGFQPGTEVQFINGSIAGDIHIDNRENWIDGFDLATVLLHEIGHALGLAHSNAPGSVLNANYQGERLTLSQDDIDGIQSLYGAATIEPSVVPLPGAPILFLSAVALIGFIKKQRASIRA